MTTGNGNSISNNFSILENGDKNNSSKYQIQNDISAPAKRYIPKENISMQIYHIVTTF